MVTTTYLTVRQVAEQWGVSKSIVYALVSDGVLPALRVGRGRGTIRIKASDALAYEERRKRNDEAEYSEHFA